MAWEHSTRRADLPADWRTRRVAVLERDQYRCVIRGPRCTGRATEVDHTGARTDHRLEQLRAACHACHADRTGRQATAAREARRRRRVEPPPGLIEG